MESYLDSRLCRICVGIVFLALCGAFYLGAAYLDAPHPLMSTLLFALGIVLICVATSALWALLFVPLLKFLAQSSDTGANREPGDIRLGERKP